jgi:integration host factor subunit alpha
MFHDVLEISNCEAGAVARLAAAIIFLERAGAKRIAGASMSNTEEQRSNGSAAKHERAVRTVTRADLSETVYRRVGLSRSESAELVQEFLDEICDAAARGETVKLSSFGSFVVRSKSERIGRNPKTGVEVPILPRRVMVFKPSNVLKARINGVSAPDEN